MAFPKNSISEVIASSLTRAQYEYFEMTGKKGFREVSKSIPEKVLEVAAARSCYQHLRGSSNYILQEFQFSRFNEIAKGYYGITNCRKFEGDMRRIDIVIKNGDGGIEAVLEINRNISSTGSIQESDIGRLLEVRNYFLEKSNTKIEALFAYPITFNFSIEDDFKEEEFHQCKAAQEIFGKNYSMSKGEYRVKFPEEDFYFSFGAVCGKV